MGIDLAEFYEREPKQCIISRRVRDLPELDTLNAALRESKITTASILRWLAKRGVRVNADSLRSHRLGTCSCRD